jgi:ligand-binding sensor domain-containing protein
MNRSALIGFGLAIALASYAAQKGETKVDSIVYDTGMEWKVFNSSGPVNAFTIQSDLLYIATADELTVLPTGSTSRKSEMQTFAKLGTMPAAGITTLATDSTGSVWAGTKEGAAQKTKSGWVNFTKEKGLAGNAVAVIAVAPDASVWVGTDEGVSIFKTGAWKSFTAKDGLPGASVQALVFDGRGNAWVGTNKGIGVYDGGKWTIHSMKNGMSWNDTKALAYDGRKNMIWAAVGDQDVNTFDGKAWNTYMNIQMGIKSIMVDTQSRVWFGYDQGLIKFNGEEWISDAKKHGIPAVMVTQMHRDGKGNLWFASQNEIGRASCRERV